MTGKEILVKELKSSVLSSLFEDYYGESLTSNGTQLQAETYRFTLNGISNGSVVQQVNTIIHKAIEVGASDIHVEPYEERVRVRYRMDGVLQHIGELSLMHKDALISRIKIMAHLDIAEKRRPQDGRIRIEKEKNSIDLRVSTLPTDFGEKVVLRILDKSEQRLDLKQLGFEQENLKTFRKAINHPYGMILVTGPTGSGKTTTLYSALNELNTDQVNITTIEDPIEYNLVGINQTHVRSDIGLTFSHALRSILRQDPNIIMVGEIRDLETAEIAIRAALTGHLVLSTLHTNDAPSAITRIVDMGIESFLVASSVRLVMAQRLVRRICESCKQEYVPDEILLKDLNLNGSSCTFYKGEGCEQCNGSHGLKKQAIADGMVTLREAGIQKIRDGLTTPEEVFRETVV